MKFFIGGKRHSFKQNFVSIDGKMTLFVKKLWPWLITYVLYELPLQIVGGSSYRSQPGLDTFNNNCAC